MPPSISYHAMAVAYQQMGLRYSAITGALSPSDIYFSVGGTIADNASGGTTIGTLAATDADSSSWTWTIVTQPSGLTLALSGSNPAGTIDLNYSSGTLTPGTKTVRIRADDGSSTPYEEDITFPVTDSASDVLLETITFDQFSGASRTSPYVTFARDFVMGAVPSGSKIELRYASSAITLQQTDGRALHSDSSLRRGIFSCKPSTGAVADNGTFDIEVWKVSGSFSNTTSINRSTLTGHDFKVRVRIGGTDYYCLLNNCDAAGNYREIRAGSTVRAWEHWGVLRNGTGGASTDQGQLQAKFFSYVWSDGSVTVMARVVNGRVSNGTSYTVQQAEFLDNTTSIVNFTSSFTFYAHNAIFFCDPLGQPYWSAGLNFIEPRAAGSYFPERSLTWRVYTNTTRNAALGRPTIVSYEPNYVGGTIGGAGIDAGGPSRWIGHLPVWSAMRQMTNDDTTVSAGDRKTFLLFDNTEPYAQTTKHPGWYYNEDTGLPPVLVNQDYTASGLSSAEPGTQWGPIGGATLADSGGTITGATHNSSHGPAYSHNRWMVSGWEWWFDNILTLVVGTLGARNQGTTESYTRRPLINSINHDSSIWSVDQMREIAWALRDCSLARWTCPDNHPMKAYLGQILTNSWIVSNQMNQAPFSDSQKQKFGIWPTNYLIPPADGHYWDIGWSNFQGSYLTGVLCMLKKRADVSADHVITTAIVPKFLLGPHQACMYWTADAYVLSYRAGTSADELDPIVSTDWSDAYVEVNTGTGNHNNIVTKLISNTGGVSGACPVSGVGGGGWFVGHDYPNLLRGAADCAVVVGYDVTALAAKISSECVAKGFTDAAWASSDGFWFDIRGT